ncbi:biotin carboxylase [Actinoplanes sp. URMC 104]|uniref:biotin carboxylase n=1 Tax=Actinoplanes sp. URMC 104 TaxID=3423409 RepID=UPI003F1B7C2D
MAEADPAKPARSTLKNKTATRKAEPAKAKKSAATGKKAAAKPAQKLSTKKSAAKKPSGKPAKHRNTEPATATSADAAPSVTATSAPARTRLRGVSSIRAFFRRNTTPIYFVSPTPFNLLGIDRWVSNFHYVNYYDSFDGAHPHVFLPRYRGVDDFGSMEEMNNFLLGHPEFAAFAAEQGSGGKAVLVMVDDRTEQLAAERGIDLALPPAALRHRLDSKLVTTRLGNEAGVPSVPNVLGSVAGGPDAYDQLLALAAGAGLGTDLVVQLPWGDSGKTTFFVDSRAAWDTAAAGHELTDVELKIMKRINCRPIAVEAVLTRHGTLVGPLMSDITGHPELTPYKGGWAGNDVYLDVLDETQRARARVLTQHLGDRLASEGYRGFFEVDYLVDTDTGELYLGELNPRLSGISSMTNVTAGAYAELPLFLFHLLEYLDVDYEIDVDEINARWADPDTIDVWSQVVIKHTGDETGLIQEAPATGIWRMRPSGELTFDHSDTDWHDLTAGTAGRRGFYLRVSGPGDYLYKGADIGILVSRGRLQTDLRDGRAALTPLCHKWVDGIRRQVRSASLGDGHPPAVPGAVK